MRLVIWLAILAGFLSVYILIVRPLLHRWSVTDPFMDRTDSFWAKVGDVLDGWKVILWARLQVILGAVATVYAAVEPFLDQAFSSPGTDWKELLPADKRVLLVPIILIGGGLLTEYLRRISRGSIAGPAADKAKE